MADDDGQRLAVLRVTGEFLRDHFFRPSPPGQWFRVEAGIPADAKCVRMWIDHERNCLMLLYSHPSFRLVRPGCVAEDAPAPMFTMAVVTPEELRHLSERRTEAALAMYDAAVPAAEDDDADSYVVGG